MYGSMADMLLFGCNYEKKKPCSWCEISSSSSSSSSKMLNSSERRRSIDLRKKKTRKKKKRIGNKILAACDAHRERKREAETLFPHSSKTSKTSGSHYVW